MFCPECGAEIKEGNKFCIKCGTSIETGEQAVYVSSVPMQEAVVPEPVMELPKPKKKPALWKVFVPLAGLCVLAVVGVGIFMMIKKLEAQSTIEEATAYMEQQSYGKAVSSYRKALEYDSENTDVKLALAKAYMCQEDFEQAEDVLKGISLEKSDERSTLYQYLQDIVGLEPAVEAVDTTHFPTVTIEMSQESDLVLETENFTLQEEGEAREILKVVQEDDKTFITYLAEDTELDAQKRSATLDILVNQIAFKQEYDYETPTYSDAVISLVSTDVSEYPKVKAYFRVMDTNTGENVGNLTEMSFHINERLKGGEYLSREVKSAVPLRDYAGLNIDLVADKSSSISNEDMDKIKKVMIEFVNSLHFEVGDQAEVLAFDSVVQQMCYYTDDVTLLTNGINSMSTDGMTAFYDAVYDGITHAALQGGARCVVAFTDGEDNESIHTESEVIRYSNEKQVPVYVIGVGYYLDEYTLKNIAESTGGRYWYIDDLYDLQKIFDQVYYEQKDLYVVEYESDNSVDCYTSRELQVKVSGCGYRSATEVDFTPVRSINDNGGVKQTSRYVLIKECLTWSEASQRCQEMGGHLATVTSQDEMDQLIALAEANDVKYVWLGGNTSYDNYGNVFGHWVTGESFSYQAWSVDEPSRVDKDGVEEWYIMLWNIPSLGGWTWNDQRNDPASAVVSMKDSMAFICEFEN